LEKPGAPFSYESFLLTADFESLHPLLSSNLLRSSGAVNRLERHRGFHLDLKRFVIGFVFAAGIVLICIRWIDRAVALLLARNMPQVVASHIENVPDLLLPITLAVSAAAWAGYAWLKWKKSRLQLRHIFATIGLSSLLSFAAKDVLQLLLGRFTPKEWLASPDLTQFHFLGANGFSGAFPSGHMCVLTPVLIALYRMFPSLRALWILLWAALALALLAGSYHFVSDVIAGAYLGFSIDSLALYVTLRLVTPAGRLKGTDSPEA
jgi:membrane-associated phospholipid phosphatase